MGRRTASSVEGRIWHLFENKYSFRKIRKQLQDEAINISFTAIRNVCNRLQKKASNDDDELSIPGPGTTNKTKELTEPELKLALSSSMKNKYLIQMGTTTTTASSSSSSELPEMLNQNQAESKSIKSTPPDDEKSFKYPPEMNQNNYCLICASSFLKDSADSAHSVTDDGASFKIENGIKYFSQLFSLPLNYFEVELQVSNVTLFRRLCCCCREKLELISSVFCEIEKLQRNLVELKKSLEMALTLDARFQCQIRQQLQQRIFSQCMNTKTLNSEKDDELRISLKRNLQKLENVVDHIDADLYVESVRASPVSSNFHEVEGDVFDENETNTLLKEIKEEEAETLVQALWTENNSTHEFRLIDHEQDVEHILEESELSVNQKIQTENQNSNHIISSAIANKAGSSNLNSKWKSMLTRDEMDLVRDAGLQKCSVVLSRLELDTPTVSDVDWPKEVKKPPKRRRRSFPCDHCDRTFTKTDHLARHSRLVHGIELSYDCQVCDSSFTSKLLFQRHQKTHTMKVMYTCTTCSSQFQKRKQLFQHRKVHPFERSRRVCHECGKTFEKRTGLLFHQRKHHGAPYPYICSNCQRGFNYEKDLLAHQAYHLGEKQFQCNQCPSSFPLQIALNRHVLHMHVKSREQLFTCQICSRSYKSRGSLVMHLRTHTGQRPFVCLVCGMSFVFKEKLEKHQSIHTNVRPYLCQECGFSCRLKELLHSHLKVHEFHRRLRESVKKDESAGRSLGKFPVPRLAKPRNRRLRFPKLNQIVIVGPVGEAVEERETGTEPETGAEPEPDLPDQLDISIAPMDISAMHEPLEEHVPILIPLSISNSSGSIITPDGNHEGGRVQFIIKFI